MPDNNIWITGAYEPVADEEWVSFAYGPFPSQEAGQARADDDQAMRKALGLVAKDYEIDCIDPLSYNQACKHFDETIQSEHFPTE